MKILSLFDGMACGMLAMMEAGVEVSEYHAFEIDTYATKTSSHNFPMIQHHGDVFKADFTEFAGFDYLIGGSPCTYWSGAKTVGRETDASGLGWELFRQYVRALNEAKPKFFIYENNKSMSKAIRASIDEAFGFEAVCINSALGSAQNRQRLYWVGKRNEDGTYSKVHVEQPEDRGSLFRDVLERNGKELTEREIDYMFRKEGRTEYGYIQKSTEEKSKCITANIAKGVPYNCLFEKIEEDGKLYRRFETHGESKANALTTVQTYSMVAIPKAISDADGKEYTVYEVRDGKITIKGREYPVKLADGFYIIRKLTVRECMRLQTVPEWYEFPVSDSQAYKQLGNGWTVSVISHLIRATLEESNG